MSLLTPNSDRAVLGISTPLGEDNYYSQLSNLLDENERPWVFCLFFSLQNYKLN